MKSKFVFLSTIVSAGLLSVTGYADDRHPNMPSGGGQKCYPGNGSCPNRIQSVDGNGNQNWAPQSKKLKMQSAEKFKGTVESVNRERYPDNRIFIQIILNTEEGEKTILVGPASYIDQSKVKLQTGDKVTVTGFRVDANGEEVIMAKEIDKSGNILRLLDDQRQPLWKNGMNGNGRNGNGYNTNGNGNGYGYNSNGNGNGYGYNRNGNGNGYSYNSNGNGNGYGYNTNGNGYSNNGNGNGYNGNGNNGNGYNGNDYR